MDHEYLVYDRLVESLRHRAHTCLLLVILCLVPSPSSVHAGTAPAWTDQSRLPSPPGVTDAVFANHLDGWAIAGSYVLSTHDGGETWSRQLLALAYGGLKHIEFPDALHGYISDNAWNLWGTTDGGRTWSIVASDKSGTTSVTDFAAPAPTTIYVLDERSFQPGIKVSTDGGHTWTLLSGPGVPLAALAFVTVRNGWAGSIDSLEHTLDGGTTWTTVRLPFASYAICNGVWFPTASLGFASSDGSLARTADGGRTWKLVDLLGPHSSLNVGFLGHVLGLPHPFSHIAFSTPKVGMMLVVDSMLTTRDGGTSWRAEPLPQEAVFAAGYRAGTPFAFVPIAVANPFATMADPYGDRLLVFGSTPRAPAGPLIMHATITRQSVHIGADVAMQVQASIGAQVAEVTTDDHGYVLYPLVALQETAPGQWVVRLSLPATSSYLAGTTIHVKLTARRGTQVQRVVGTLAVAST